MGLLVDAYGALPNDPYTSPLLNKRIKDLPKTYILAAGMDTLRDDAQLFKRALDDAGYVNSSGLEYNYLLTNMQP
jgi:acetyl esterase/lipase